MATNLMFYDYMRIPADLTGSAKPPETLLTPEQSDKSTVILRSIVCGAHGPSENPATTCLAFFNSPPRELPRRQPRAPRPFMDALIRL